VRLTEESNESVISVILFPIRRDIPKRAVF
jgi:hypothetical protein